MSQLNVAAALVHYQSRLLLSERLGLHSVLRELRQQLGCDVLMLVSLQTAANGTIDGQTRCLVSSPANAAKWKDLAQRGQFYEYLHQARESVKGAQIRGDAAERMPVADFAPSDLSAYACAAAICGGSVTSDPIVDLRLSGPLPLSHICIGLLGYVMIGDWALGETLFVAANASTKRTTIQAAHVYPYFVAFCGYLAEVNSHFYRKACVDREPKSKRLELLRDSHVREGYIRSATRLAPLIDKDIGTTVRTLVEIDGLQLPVGGLRGAMTSGTVNEFTVCTARKALAHSHYCTQTYSRGNSTSISSRQRCVDAMWKWAELLQGVQHLQGKLRAPVANGDAMPNKATAPHTYSYVDAESSKLVRIANGLLSELPSVLWAGFTTSAFELRVETLCAFFISKLAEWRKTCSHAQSVLSGAATGVGVHERLLFLNKLAHVAELALEARRPDSQSLQSLLWLVCEYAHEALGLDRRVDLESRLNLAAMEQPALFGLKRFYRDHLFHVIQVCLSGWLLLESGVGGSRIINKIARYHGGKKGKVDVLRQWFVSSLLHDMGYVIEVGKGWGELLELFHRDGLRELQANIEICTQALSAEATLAGWGFSTEDKPGEDHGVVSALYARSLLGKFGRSDYASAVAAMAHHNHENVRIRFRDHPLSALLVLCDELQEWDRPWMDLEGVGIALAAAISAKGHVMAATHHPLDRVTVTLKPSWRKKGLTFTCNRRLRFTLQYGGDIHRNDGVFAAWLGRSRALQRLDLTGAGFEIEYLMESDVEPPVELGRRNRDEPQMERLRRLVREKSVWGVEPWLPEHGASANGVVYKLASGGKKEKIVLRVGKLGKVQPVHGGMREFWKAASEWSGAWDGKQQVP